MQLKLNRANKRFLALIALLPTTVLVLGWLYMVGMTQLEGTPRTFLQGLQWASETITNTGYGADNRWNHPVMALFVIITQFEVRLQHVLPPMSGKVLFYRYGPAIESLLEEFNSKQTPFVIFEEDQELARSLRDRGYNVVYGKLADGPAPLLNVREAKAVVTNSGDHANATFTMVVREHGFAGPLYALANDPLYRQPMVQIGATEVFTPAHVLGAALASKASTRISPPAEGMHLLGTKVRMAEFRIHAHADLEIVERMAMPIRRAGPIVLAGFGAVGQKVVEMLQDAGETCVVIDRASAPGVTLVGNVLERGILAQAGVHDASAVVLALSDDSESVFAAAVVRDYSPDVPLIVRVLRTPNTTRIYRAGADFAISVGQVAGQILAYQLLGEQVLQVENGIKFVRMSAGALAGKHPWGNEELDRTGAKVIAVERHHEVLVEFGQGFEIRADDALFVCGSLNSLDRYQLKF